MAFLIVPMRQVQKVPQAQARNVIGDDDRQALLGEHVVHRHDAGVPATQNRILQNPFSRR
jgi:hypothetical protein